MNSDTGSEGSAPAMCVTGESAGASAGEFPTTPLLDAQTGNANGADWQEEVYQKIKSMKEMYLSELNDLYQKIASKVQQNDSLPQRPQNENIEKLKMFKMMLERIVLFLGLNKHQIQLTHKEKVLSVEKHISFFLRANRPRKPTSSPLQEQLPQSSIQLQQPQSLDGQTNPPMQPVQVAAMQQNNLTNLQDNILSGVSTISNSQQHMINIGQPGSSLDVGQGNSLNSLQQVAAGSLQQNPANNPQQVNISSLRSQSGTNPVQENLGFLQQNSNALQQSLPKLHEQQMLQNQQLTPLCNQLLMQQQFFQGQQLMQQQQAMHQQIVQSPSTSLAPSPMPGDSEKVCAGLAPHTTAGNIMPQQATVASAPQLHQALSPQNTLTNLQHNSLSGKSAISNSQQHMINILQPGSNLDLGQGNSLTLLQQQNQQLIQQCYQLQQEQQLLQRQRLMQQQIVQLRANRMSQLHQMTAANDLKMRQQMGMNTGVLQQQQSVGQRVGSPHPQLKSGIASPQVHQALSPQVANGSLQQNPVNKSSLSLQSGANPVQANLGSLQQSSSVLPESLFKLPEQQMLLSQQLRQQYQQLQMQQLLFQRQQLMQMLMQQQQAKHQQISQLPTHQMSQLHQMTDANNLKMRQQMGMKTGVLQQQQSVGQPAGSHHPQLKSGIASPQLHQALLSPQAQNTKYLHIMGSGPQDIASEFDRLGSDGGLGYTGLGYAGMVLGVTVLLLLVFIGWVIYFRSTELWY